MIQYKVSNKLIQIKSNGYDYDVSNNARPARMTEAKLDTRTF